MVLFVWRYEDIIMELIISRPIICCNIIFAVADTSVEKGSIIQAAVLDVAKTEPLVDLSLKTEFVDKFKEESSQTQKHKKV